MQNVNPKRLRAELKDYLDLAAKEPIRIQRRSGDNYVLMNESVYAELQNEVLSLQRRLLGMSNILDGKVEEYTPGDRSRLSRFKKKA